MINSATIGFHRIGANAEIPLAVKKYLSKNINAEELLNVVADIRKQTWEIQKNNYINIIPSNDISLYDNVLDMTCLLGNIPKRYYWEGGKVPLEIYFTMTRGQQKDKFDVLPLELQYYFDTNYMYFVPEFEDPIDFAYSDNKSILEYLNAKNNLQIETRPVIIGPMSYFLLGKIKDDHLEEGEIFSEMLEIYKELFINYSRINVKRVQIDEPCLTSELDKKYYKLYIECFAKLKEYAGNIKIDLTTYYGSIESNLDLVFSLHFDSLHIDTELNEKILHEISLRLSKKHSLSLGIVNGSNVWVNDLSKSLKTVNSLLKNVSSDRIIVAPSAPMYHIPYSLIKSNNILKEISPNLAFVTEKLAELNLIKNELNGKNTENNSKIIDTNRQILKNNNISFKSNAKIVTEVDNFFVNFDVKSKKIDYQARKKNLDKQLNIPLIPTTIIGKLKNQECTTDIDIKNAIKENVDLQIKSGIDVITSGNPERVNDLEFFASQIGGCCVVDNNPIVKFGHHLYNPVIIYSDINSNGNISTKYLKFLQSLTDKHVKTSMIGPVSFINSCFIPPNTDLFYLYKESVYLFHKEFKTIIDSNIKIIEIDETEIFSKLLLRPNLSTTFKVKEICRLIDKVYENQNNDTKVILYIGYFDFKDTIEELCRIGVDVLFVESARSFHEILTSFISYKPQMEIGLGVFDVKDNRIPTVVEISSAIKKLTMFFDENQIWIIPDAALIYKDCDSKDMQKILTILSNSTKEIHNMMKSEMEVNISDDIKKEEISIKKIKSPKQISGKTKNKEKNTNQNKQKIKKDVKSKK